jgi:beta-1,2-mannobiose phosphorylase / 1,2-beta-oligomannan phosphorylase
MEITRKLLITNKEIIPSFKDLDVKGILNPAAVRLPNKKIMLLARVIESYKQNRNKGVRCPVIISKKEKKAHFQNIKKNKILRSDENMIFLKDGTVRLSTISHFRKIILDESGFEVQQVDNNPSFIGKPGESEFGVEDPRITKIGTTYYMTYVGISSDEGISTFLASSYYSQKKEMDTTLH